MAALSRYHSVSELNTVVQDHRELVELNLLRMESHRLKTFKKAHQYISDLTNHKISRFARNGHYFPGPGINIRCIFCLKNVPVGLARRYSGYDCCHHKHCYFPQGFPCGNIPINPNRHYMPQYTKMPQHLIDALEFEPPEMDLLLVGMPQNHDYDFPSSTDTSESDDNDYSTIYFGDDE